MSHRHHEKDAMTTEPTTTRPTTAPARTARPRLTWVDQVRWVAIVLIVLGHFVGLLRGRSDLARGISDFVYLFHIPALVLLAGWGARRLKASGDGLVTIFWQLLVPYVAFQLVAFAADRLLEGKHPSWSFTYQTFGLWFLVALAGWRLVAPWFHGLRWPVPAALAVALLAGLSPRIGEFLSLSRIAFFLPLFVAGPWVVDQVARLRTLRAARAGGAVVLLVGALWVGLQEPTFDRTIFFGRDGYAALDQGVLQGVAYRLGALAISTALAVSLMLVVPGRPGAPTPAGRWFAQAGRYTMFPYLIHLPLLTVLGWTGWPDDGRPAVTTVLFVLGAVAASALLVTPPVRLLAGPFVEPRTWIRRFTRG